ncbi:MAG TPA: adenylosuccinate lyase [Solirubrobacteraceae bacterium]|nr:adenylosuccinate lyase [Solirubrobacteraceae bacterium]
MIARYTRPELGAIWTDAARMEAWRRVEVAACEELPWLLGAGARGGPPDGGPAAATGPTPDAPASAGAGAAGPTPAELEAIRAATFTVEEVDERERATDHDVAAFVDVLAASAGEAGRWIHYGLTSSDVLDTALALQLRQAGALIVPGAQALAGALARRAREHVETLCVGRTHGVHAEPTTFGVKLAGFAFEAHRNALRLERAFAQAAVGAISGAVGTYAATSPEFERRVLARLDLEREPVSTQVVARDRHAELLGAIALAGAGMERLATEVRHLQRTEVREVQEPFRAGQKGSSAMPHKRNPIRSEQLTGLARVLRGNAQASLEDVALWHERDISHSSVERVILPDSTILLDYMQHRAIALVEGMTVDGGRMRTNLEITCGALFSQRVLLALVAAGMSRDDAYYGVQRAAQQAWDTGTPLRKLLADDPVTGKLDLDAIFDYGHFVRYAHEIVGRLDEIAPR